MDGWWQKKKSGDLGGEITTNAAVFTYELGQNGGYFSVFKGRLGRSPYWTAFATGYYIKRTLFLTAAVFTF